jgi:Predicted membrane protein (DUF2335)
MNKKIRNSPPSQVRAADAAARQAFGPSIRTQEVVLQEQSVTVQVQLPPPSMLRQYDEARPGTADLLIRWNEEEQAHRRHIELTALNANVQSQRKQTELAEQQVKTQREALMFQAQTVRRSDSSGQYLGWLLCAGAIAGAVYLALNGHDVVAAVLAAIPTAAVVQSFRSLTRQDARDTPKKP